MRKVEFCKYGYYNGTGINEPSAFSIGRFHGFFSGGNNKDGVECYGLVELMDGTLHMETLDRIKFLDRPIDNNNEGIDRFEM